MCELTKFWLSSRASTDRQIHRSTRLLLEYSEAPCLPFGTTREVHSLQSWRKVNTLPQSQGDTSKQSALMSTGQEAHKLGLPNARPHPALLGGFLARHWGSASPAESTSNATTTSTVVRLQTEFCTRSRSGYVTVSEYIFEYLGGTQGKRLSPPRPPRLGLSCL